LRDLLSLFVFPGSQVLKADYAAHMESHAVAEAPTVPLMVDGAAPCAVWDYAMRPESVCRSCRSTPPLGPGAMRDHLRLCPAHRPCPLEECTFAGSASALEAHMKRCPFWLIKDVCETSGELIITPRAQWSQHIATAAALYARESARRFCPVGLTKEKKKKKKVKKKKK
jgi:hypothetical protein